MPSWITHIATANKLTQKIQMDNKDEFIFANVAPDILEGYIVKDISKIKTYDIVHFARAEERNGLVVPLPDIDKFKKMYKSDFQNKFILGYYTHLLTDYYWNNYCYSNHFYMYDKEKNQIRVKHLDGNDKIEKWHEAIIEKQKDFRLYTKHLQKQIEIGDFDENKILADSNGFDLSKSDILNTIDYLKNIKNLEIKQEYYTMFNEEVLNQVFDKSIDFIAEKIAEVI